ncbi:T-cell surface antigen CD2-like isoform X3 [Syngnathus acus]|uniref:T-cell surface antigen CD2-like isoform X3 n=1 Tax=Syngnathus acus TaxID=161584 RepID=UPI001885D77D|nr:T-cell surface antigen CD2-like isoform X3 [Syngnathus acus]
MRFWLLRQEITFILPSSCSSCQSAMKLKVMVRILPSSIVSLLLLGCRLTCADSQDACEAYALIGGNFNVPLYHNLQKSEKLRWIHNKTKIFDQRNDKVVIGKPNDILQNGSLKLTNLKRNSEGTYVPEVYDVKGKLLTDAKKLYLCVLDPVSKPGLKVECALPNVKFTCTSDQIQKAIVEWFQNGKLLPQKNQPTVLQIVQNVKHDLFTCKVSNRLSSMSSEAVKQNCTDSSSIFPKELFGLDFKIMVSILAGIGGLALLLIIILIVCCVRAIREKRKRAKDVEELRLAWSKPERQQHQCPHHSHGQRGMPQRSRSQAQANVRKAKQVEGQTGSRPAGADQQAPPRPQPRKKLPAQRK